MLVLTESVGELCQCCGKPAQFQFTTDTCADPKEICMECVQKLPNGAAALLIFNSRHLQRVVGLTGAKLLS